VPPDLVEKALLLDKAYIPSRYPDAYPSGAPFKRFTEGEARSLVQASEAIVGFLSRSSIPDGRGMSLSAA